MVLPLAHTSTLRPRLSVSKGTLAQQRSREYTMSLRVRSGTPLDAELPWEKVGADTAAAAADAARGHRLARMPAPPAPEPELTPLATLDTLPPGKHAAKRVAASGAIESVQCVTKKLLFLYLRCSETGRLWECIAKLADGFFALPAIAQLGAAAAGRTCSLLAYPERAVAGAVSLHVVSITLTATADGAQALTLPEAVQGGDRRIYAVVPAADAAAAAAAVPRTRLSSSGNRVRPANANRFMVLAQWLVDTFGRETLVRDGGVLDVAGGAGGVRSS